MKSKGGRHGFNIVLLVITVIGYILFMFFLFHSLHSYIYSISVILLDRYIIRKDEVIDFVIGLLGRQ